MPICENREYRSVNISDLNIEERKEGKETFFVEGYAATFDQYELFTWGDETYYERILPEAFKEADMTDVIFQKDHSGTVFARTSNHSIEIEINEHGLHHRTDLGRTSAAKQMYEEIAAGMYPQMSFAFTVADDEITRIDEHKLLRTIKKFKKVYDVSAVSFPANPNTEIGVSARSAFDGFIEAEAQELAKRAEALELAKAKYNYIKE